MFDSRIALAALSRAVVVAAYRRRIIAHAVAIGALLFGNSAQALIESGAGTSVRAAPGRALFGYGEGVTIGIVDSGIDATRQAFFDDLDLTRVLGQTDFVGDGLAGDPNGHGTAVTSIAAGRGWYNTTLDDFWLPGVATKAHLLSARVLDADGSGSETQARNGLGYLLDHGAQVVNLSLHYSGSGGGGGLTMLSDWAAYELGVTVVTSAGNTGDAADTRPQMPGDGFNVLTVGATANSGWFKSDYDQVADFSSYRSSFADVSKPDLVAPGTNITYAIAGAPPEFGAGFVKRGTSFAAPHVAGAAALQIGYGQTHGLSTSPMLIKATMLNTAAPVNDAGGQPWEPAGVSEANGVTHITAPLDEHSGAGQLDITALYHQYVAGEHEPGLVPSVGWDLNEAIGLDPIDYVLNVPLAVGDTLTATLTWLRHVIRHDDGDGAIDSGDWFELGEFPENLDLWLLRDGVPVAVSEAQFLNVEHIRWDITVPGEYSLRVIRQEVARTDDREAFALAWRTSAIPQPSSGILLLTASAGLLARLRTRGRWVAVVGASLKPAGLELRRRPAMLMFGWRTDTPPRRPSAPLLDSGRFLKLTRTSTRWMKQRSSPAAIWSSTPGGPNGAPASSIRSPRSLTKGGPPSGWWSSSRLAGGWRSTPPSLRSAPPGPQPARPSQKKGPPRAPQQARTHRTP